MWPSSESMFFEFLASSFSKRCRTYNWPMPSQFLKLQPAGSSGRRCLVSALGSGVCRRQYAEPQQRRYSNQAPLTPARIEGGRGTQDAVPLLSQAGSTRVNVQSTQMQSPLPAIPSYERPADAATKAVSTYSPEFEFQPQAPGTTGQADGKLPSEHRTAEDFVQVSSLMVDVQYPATRNARLCRA